MIMIPIENLILYILQFLICLIIFLMGRRIKKEEKIRYVQDLKLYNYIKSNYNALIGKRLPVEDKIEKDGEKNQYF